MMEGECTGMGGREGGEGGRAGMDGWREGGREGVTHLARLIFLQFIYHCKPIFFFSPHHCHRVRRVDVVGAEY